jgi:hypothetical protein
MEREISIILKVKGAEAAKKAISEVFNNTAISQVNKFTTQTNKAASATQRMGAKAKSASTGIKYFTQSLGRGMAALYLYNRAWNIFGTQFQEGLQLQRASDQFGLNVGNVTKMLPELRSATKGVISDFDLLKTASKAFQLGLKPERMASAFKMGTIAAQKLGLEASDAINTITNALTKQDEGALNTLGITTNVNQAYKTQVALISKSGGVMSSAMGIQIRQSLIMKELSNRFGGANKVQEDGLLILERFKASWKNFRAVIGQTLGTALIPLTRVLTGVLDTMTRLLDKMNDTAGFQKFVQISATLAGIWAGTKFISTARTLLSLFGLMGAGGASRGILRTVHNMGLLSRAMSAKKFLAGSSMFQAMNIGATKLGQTLMRVSPMGRNFVAALGLIAPRLAGIVALVPGWGTAIMVLTLMFKPLVKILEKALVAGKVFFQLLSNFDASSGLSKVLKKDAEQLGDFYYAIESLAKVALFVGSAFKGLVQGISEPISQAMDIMGKVFNYVDDLTGGVMGSIGRLLKTGPALSSWLQNTANIFKMLGKAIGFAASALVAFVNPIAGIAGMATFGASIGGDIAEFANTVGVDPKSRPDSAQSRVDAFRAGTPQTSTQQSTPEARSMNLDYSEDASNLMGTLVKEIKKQTGMMEKDSQNQTIRQSQVSAQDKVWTRR